MSFYLKDLRWLASKVSRLSHKRSLTIPQTSKLLDQTLEPNLMRLEMAIFGLENILLLGDTSFLDDTQTIIFKFLSLTVKIEQQYKQEFDILYEEIPPLYYRMELSEHG